jgi:hypothetical protein
VDEHPRITDAQRRYLRCFDEWMRDPSDKNLERRRNALDLVCLEAGVIPVKGPDVMHRLEKLIDALEHLVADLRELRDSERARHESRTANWAAAARSRWERRCPSAMRK